jgi:hypothetical protein
MVEGVGKGSLVGCHAKVRVKLDATRVGVKGGGQMKNQMDEGEKWFLSALCPTELEIFLPHIKAGLPLPPHTTPPIRAPVPHPHPRLPPRHTMPRPRPILTLSVYVDPQ